MKVLIITEGGKGIGSGHITRCLSLYQAFEEKRIIPEFIVNGSMTAEDLSVIKGCRSFNWLEEKERLFGLAKKADIAIVDSYLADLDVYKKISQLARISAYIDDNKRLNYPKGIVINGTIYAKELNYPKNKEIVYLLGSKYIPIRKDFWNVPIKRIKKKITDIVITFGGYDGRDMTPKALKILNDNCKKIEKNVVVGKEFRNVDKLEKYKNRKTNFIYNPNARLMKEIMLNSDIAISAGGQTLYELARVGVPSIGICMAGNQEGNLKGWQEEGFVEYIGWHDDKSLPSKLLQAIDKISSCRERIRRSKIGKSLVDGKGAERIVERIV